MTTDPEIARLREKRLWLEIEQEKVARKRPYRRLPKGHPDFDAEDLPHRWQRWALEGATALLLAAFVVGVAILAQPLGPLLPDLLARLSGR